MKQLLELLRGVRLLAKGMEGGNIVLHYLLPDGRVLEIVGAPR